MSAFNAAPDHEAPDDQNSKKGHDGVESNLSDQRCFELHPQTQVLKRNRIVHFRVSYVM